MSTGFWYRVLKPRVDALIDAFVSWQICEDCDTTGTETMRLDGYGNLTAKSFNSTARVNVVKYGAVADWNGASGTDNKAAFNAAITYLKSVGGGILEIPSALHGYWINGDWTIADANGITVEQRSPQYNQDVVLPTKGRLVFTGAGHGIKITNATRLDFNGVTVDGTATATNPISVDRMVESVWQGVSVYNAAALGWKLFDSTGVADKGVLWCTFINCNFDRCPKSIELTGVIGTSGVFHSTFINMRTDFSGAASIDLISCDNVHFISTYTFRRSGSGVGMRWVKTGGYYPTSIYLTHFQGEIEVPFGAYNPGAILHYDMANGQAFPTLPTGTVMPILTSGLNSVGQLIPQEIIANTFTQDNGAAGKLILDSNDYGVMRYNGSNGNGVIEKLDSTSRGNHRLINPDGSGFILTSKETVASLALSGAISPGTEAGSFQTGKVYMGSGVPDNAYGSVGDFYIRTGGTAAGKTLFYHKESTTWVAAIP